MNQQLFWVWYNNRWKLALKFTLNNRMNYRILELNEVAHAHEDEIVEGPLAAHLKPPQENPAFKVPVEVE